MCPGPSSFCLPHNVNCALIEGSAGKLYNESAQQRWCVACENKQDIPVPGSRANSSEMILQDARMISSEKVGNRVQVRYFVGSFPGGYRYYFTLLPHGLQLM